MTFKPKFISFDCYGTLINFEMGPTARRLFADRVPAERMPAFLDSFRAYRLDEVLARGHFGNDQPCPQPSREPAERSIAHPGHGGQEDVVRQRNIAKRDLQIRKN